MQSSDLFVIDDLSGLDSAIEQNFQTEVQKCVLHLKRNILKKVKKIDREAVAQDLSDIFQIDNPDDTANDAIIRSAKYTNK